MAKTSNYNIVVGVDFVQKDVQKKLDELQNKLKPLALKIDFADVKSQADAISKSLDNVGDSAKKAADDTEDLSMTFNVANAMFQKAIGVISDFTEKVINLDSAITEFKKVSDLRGGALDDYVDKLSEIGLQVGRTGKPNRSEPGRWDGKPAPRTAPKPLKASRALQLQHKDEICLSAIVGNY